MDEKYINIFDELFLNIEKYPQLKELINDINGVLSNLIIKYGEIVNELTTNDDRCFSQAEIILRTLLETTVSIKFILKEDTELRAASYFLYHHYEEMDKIEYFRSDNDKGQMIKNIIGDEKFNEVAIKVNKKKDALQRLINKNATFKKVDDLRKKKIEDEQNKNRRKLKVNVQWYEIVSKYKSFRQLMRYIGLDKYYESLYGGLSLEVHGYNAANSMIIKDDGSYMEQIRSPKNGVNTFNLTCVFSISVLKDIYTYLEDGDEEKQEFKDYYLKYKEISDNVIERLINIV